MLEKLHKLRQAERKIGITFSSFDLLHAGHCAMLSECKEHCDYLVVGLQTDPTIDRPKKNAPVQSVFERWVQLQSNVDVDMVVPYATEVDLIDMIHIIRPHIRFIGEEYTHLDFTGKEIEVGLFFNARKHSFSSSDLRKRIIDAG